MKGQSQLLQNIDLFLGYEIPHIAQISTIKFSPCKFKLLLKSQSLVHHSQRDGM